MIHLDFVDIFESRCAIPDSIPTIGIKKYSDFYKEFLIGNKPCILSNVSKSWNCSSQWVLDNKLNFQNLLQKYGRSVVPISKCDVSENVQQCKTLIPFTEYIEYLSEGNFSNMLYLKDWHLRKEYPFDDFYTVPEYFASDWLNEYAVDNNKDDFMFVYIGPKGSWTPFHADVYSSFSWSANVVGKKRWLLFPPGEELKFKDSFGNFPRNVESQLTNDHKYYEVIQSSGDAIFVPSGWYHQVLNIEDTISINHNWVNASNIENVWKSLKINLEMVEKEIIEYKNTDGWTDHCQIMLKALFGMNYSDFVQFISHITQKRINYLETGTDVHFEKWTFDKNHILYDLKVIECLLERILQDKCLCESYYAELKELIKQINVINNTYF